MEYSKKTLTGDGKGRERGHGPWAGISNRVFIGNLPYNCTEEMLFEAFKAVGPVVSARLVFDRDSGKSKGFGFVEYNDPETASSAVRNLQGYEIEGRGLRVDHAEPEKGQTAKRAAAAAQAPNPMNRGPMPPIAPPGAMGMAGPPAVPRDRNGLPANLPTGIPLAPGLSATDSISQTLASMPPDQLLDIMSQMKSLVTTSPEQARTLLNVHPELSYALFQAMVLMKVVDPSVLQRMLSTSLGAPQPAQTLGLPSMPPQQNNFGFNTPQPALNLPQQQPAPAYPNPLAQNLQQNMYGMAPMPPAQAAPAPQPVNSQAQTAVLQQIMAMTQAQIDALPPKEKETVMQVRQMVGSNR